MLLFFNNTFINKQKNNINEIYSKNNFIKNKEGIKSRINVQRMTCAIDGLLI